MSIASYRRLLRFPRRLSSRSPGPGPRPALPALPAPHRPHYPDGHDRPRHRGVPLPRVLDQRRVRGDRTLNWLFFGERHQATDFYYQDELDHLHRDGVLTRLDIAFSRDQRTKVYVQDRMREHGAQLWSWLQDGAHLYVCGDAGRMAKDVDRTLHDIITQHGCLAPDAADTYVKKLSDDRRYVRDIY